MKRRNNIISNPEAAYYRIKSSQHVLRANLLIHVFVLLFWVLSSIVEGVGYQPPVEQVLFSQSHIGWWFFIELFVLFIGLLSISFDISLYNDGIYINIGKIRSMIKFWCIFVIGAIISNILHLVGSILELSNCVSVLCTKNNAFLIGIISVVGTLIIIECIELYNAYIYVKGINQSRSLLESKKLN